MPHYRYRPRRRADRRTALAIGAGVVLVAASMHGHHGHLPLIGDEAGSPHGARVAIAFAEHQLGKPYEWGGTGPDAFDCSGLTMEAEAAAGITIPRTSQEQWASLPHVSQPEAGDEVFFAGADGTDASPGHVALVIGHHRMVEAYATGYPIRISTFGLASSAPGDTDPIGYARP